MKFESVVAAFSFNKLSNRIKIGSNSYSFSNNSDVFLLLKDENRIQSIVYNGMTFETLDQGAFSITEILIKGVFQMPKGNGMVYWIEIHDLRPSKSNTLNDRQGKPQVYKYFSSEKGIDEEMIESIQSSVLNESKHNNDNYYSIVALDENNNPIVNDELGMNTMTIESNLGAQTISVVKVKVPVKTQFYNVVLSSKDPKPDHNSWIMLWESNFGDATLCESQYDNDYILIPPGKPCKTNREYRLKGGHVLITSVRTSQPSKKDADVYLTPICTNHNNDRENKDNKRTPMYSRTTQHFLRLIGYDPRRPV